jgi:hypothetical protein
MKRAVRGRAGRISWRAALTPIFVLILAAGLTACSEDDPACVEEDLGAIEFTVVPDMEVGTFSFTGVLESIDPLFTAPPVVRYRFRRSDDQTAVEVSIPDFGYRMALSEGVEYVVDLHKGTVIEKLLFSWGATFRDAGGTAVLIATDWLPGYSVFVSDEGDAYPLVDGSGTSFVRVTFEDPGCKPRIANTSDLRDITNRALGFAHQGNVAQLFHAETGSLGDLEVEVFRSQRVVVKTQAVAMNQISFAISRKPETP